MDTNLRILTTVLPIHIKTTKLHIPSVHHCFINKTCCTRGIVSVGQINNHTATRIVECITETRTDSNDGIGKLFTETKHSNGTYTTEALANITQSPWDLGVTEVVQQ